MAEQPPEAITAAFLEAPRTITTPLWVAASGISKEARCLVEPLIAGAMRVHSDQSPTLDRAFLAWWIGLPRHDKGLNCFLDELTAIGFLVVYDGGTAKDGRRINRSDPRTGRRLPDTYALRLEAPDAYVGPRNLPEAYEWFQIDRDKALDEHAQRAAQGKKSRVVPVKRTMFGTLDLSQVSGRTPQDGVRDGEPYPQTRGTDLFSQVSGRTPQDGVRDGEPYPQTRGTDLFSQLSPVPPHEGYPYIGDTSGISVGEIPEVGGSAAPPADAGAGDAATNKIDWARQLVRDLPWRSVLRRELRTPEAVELAQCFRRANDIHGLSQDQVRDYALSKLANADPDKNPVRWVLGAFQDERVVRYAASLQTEPLSDTPIPMPDASAQRSEISQPASSQTQPCADDPSTWTWCRECIGVRTERGKECSADCTAGTPSADDGKGRADADVQILERGPRAKARALRSA